MASEKSVDGTLKLVDGFCSDNSAGKFYLYINWTNNFISIHNEISSAVKKLNPKNKKNMVFGKTANGYWIGYFDTYQETVGYAKLINDIHHIESRGYFTIFNAWGINVSNYRPF
jgi:hypothetical protein